MQAKRKGMLLVISGPSGVGKGTVVKLLLDEDKTFRFSVSVTTRAPREGEVDGEDYHFIDDAAYDRLLEEDAFLEHADVHGHRYGTLKSEVLERIERGESVVLDIDVQGALNVMRADPTCVSVFILPPSMTELRRRLTERGTETGEEIDRRIRNAAGEIALKDRYTYQIVNADSYVEAYRELRAITIAEKDRTSRYSPVVGD